jgi:hypothetical protein
MSFLRLIRAALPNVKRIAASLEFKEVSNNLTTYESTL